MSTPERSPIDRTAADLLFYEARTQNGFLDEPVPEEQLRKLYDLMKWAPTSANSNPVRLVFVTTPEAKARLEPCVFEGNVDKVRSAPVTQSISMPFSSPAELEVHDVCGRLVSRHPLGYLPAGTTAMQLDIGEIPSGIYFITVLTDVLRDTCIATVLGGSR